MDFSASPLALGCSGVIQWCTNPSISAKCENSSEKVHLCQNQCIAE